ncbi:MAG: hypothetical protein R2867_42555 [Caldilineaceae bacterium]
MQANGRGDIDLVGYIRVLHRHGYSGPLNLEVIGAKEYAVEQCCVIAAESRRPHAGLPAGMWRTPIELPMREQQLLRWACEKRSTETLWQGLVGWLNRQPPSHVVLEIRGRFW